MTPLTKESTNEVKEENEKLSIVKNCLKGWIEQIEAKTNDLKLEINQLKHTTKPSTHHAQSSTWINII